MAFLRIFKNRMIPLRTIVSSAYPDVTFKKETIAESIFSHCQSFSDRTAFIDDEKNVSYSYGDVIRSIKGIASSLTKKGIQQESMVCIVASNCPEYLMLKIALSSIGCTVMLCNPNYSMGELVTQFTDSRCTVLFTSENVVEKISQAASQVSFVKDIYLIGRQKPGYKSVDELMNDSGNANPIGNSNLDIDEHVAVMVYSSGTTGLPKGVMLTHKNIVSSFHQLKHLNQSSHSKIILSLPLYHIAGLNFTGITSLHSGSTLVFQPQFDVILYLRAVEKYKANKMVLVPPQILRFINDPEISKYDLSSVSQCYYGAAPLDASTMARLSEIFKASNTNFTTNQAYGLSETTSMTHLLPALNRLAGKEGSIGVLLSNMQCKVVHSSTREELSANTTGELLLKGPTIMKGYFGRPEETKKTFENKWFTTGDLGYFDSDNYFYLVDRIKDCIKMNALQISPTELEATLMALPGIVDCVVVGIPHERYQEVPKAFIVTNRDITKTEINDHMARHLSSFKQLKGGITFVDNIPKTSSGKSLRKLLRDNLN